MKTKFRITIGFAIGVLVTTCVFQFVYPPPEDALAYSGKFACIGTDLVPKYYDGIVSYDKKSTIYYKIPDCYSDAGYKVNKMFIYRTKYIAVEYYNSNFTKSSTYGGSSGDSSGGGVQPLGQ